ncbi:MAG: methyltransferase domain-containing protein [Pyrinomonas methylaliphatogenes]|nr:methyltransferase domain-containing protein [Pyrinomonas methylaliphatogenes]
MQPQTRRVDETKLQDFVGKMLGDLAIALSSSLGYIGQRLGLYKALAESGPMTPQELASHTGTTQRYIREWLINQAACGYVEYDAQTGRYSLSPEQATVLLDEDSPFYLGGAFHLLKALSQAQARITQCFRDGGGMTWGEHDADLFVGTERLFRPGYMAHIVNDWIPALTGVKEKLEKGSTVADIGCGHGVSTIIMAQSFPRSRFYGFDNHAPSIERARAVAKEAGVSDRVKFEVADSTEFPGSGYELIAYFDCFHDMADPVGSARRACDALAKDGSVMIVEPMAGERVEENFNPVGQLFSAASTLCCTPNALAAGGPALGAVATEAELREAVVAGGFSKFRRAAETPFNRIFEARH